MNAIGFAISLVGLAVALSAPGGPVAASSPATRYVDDDGTVGATGCDGARTVPKRIQRAIRAAGPGDTILVCPGTYTELLSIGGGRDDLTLKAAQAEHPVIRPPRNPPDSGLADLGGPMHLIHVEAERVTIEGFTLRPHGGSGRCQSLVAGEDGPSGLLHTWGGTSVTVRDTSFTASSGSGTCSGYDHAVLGETDGNMTVIRLERVLVRDYEVAGVAITAYGHGEPNELYIADSRFEVTRPTRGSDGEPALAVQFWGARAVVTDTVVDVGRGLAASGIVVYGDDFDSTQVEVERNQMSGVTAGLQILSVGSGEVTGNVLVGSGALAGEGIYVSGNSLIVADNVVSGFGGPGLVAGGPYTDDEVRAEEEASATPYTISSNDLRGNAGIDCVDGSAGPLGPADPSPEPNTFYGTPPRTPTPSPTPVPPLLGAWSDNRGEESMPVGLCTPCHSSTRWCHARRPRRPKPGTRCPFGRQSRSRDTVNSEAAWRPRSVSKAMHRPAYASDRSRVAGWHA